MDFMVNLIKVPQIEKMSGRDVFELMVNATHIKGDYWIFEGEPETLNVKVEVITTGITPGTGDMNKKEIINHCEEIFSFDFSFQPSSWEMIYAK